VRHLYTRERGAAAAGELPEEPDGDAVRERANLPALSARASSTHNISRSAPARIGSTHLHMYARR
jgi:hypothetical protein